MAFWTFSRTSRPLFLPGNGAVVLLSSKPSPVAVAAAPTLLFRNGGAVQCLGNKNLALKHLWFQASAEFRIKSSFFRTVTQHRLVDFFYQLCGTKFWSHRQGSSGPKRVSLLIGPWRAYRQVVPKRPRRPIYAVKHSKRQTVSSTLLFTRFSSCKMLGFDLDILYYLFVERCEDVNMAGWQQMWMTLF